MSNAVTRFLFDPVDPDRDRAPRRYQFAADSRAALVSGGAGLVALVVAAAVGISAFGVTHFLFAYLIGWVFCVSVALGALFFVMIQHLTKARWSTTIRRIPEAIAANFPLLAFAGIPVLLGMHELFHWTHADLYIVGSETYDPILAGKRGYLNVPFYLFRYVLYFTIWSTVAGMLYKLSVRNDTEPSAENTVRLRWWSALGMPLFAVSVSFAGYDFLMGTDPHWFSTMFGVYFFAGGLLGAICLIIFIALFLKRGGMLDTEVTREHMQDMAKFMFGFTVFWAYVSFCQYMLYWYANLPEEIVWFQKRFSPGWGSVAISLLLLHFAVPFFVLLLRQSKRSYPVLATMAVWLLVMHFVDLWWIAMPAMLPLEHAASPEHASAALRVGGDLLASLVPVAAETPATGMVLEVVPPAFPVVELLAWVGLFGLMVSATFARLSRHALTPHNDPYFAESLRFENV